MSIEEISIGNELKDGFKPTSKWINNGINFLSDIEEFYRERGALEKEHAEKLKLLCKKYFDKKSKLSASLSVGDNPIITPGSLESASLVLWTDVLTQTEAIADEKIQFNRQLNTSIGDNLNTLKVKTNKISKQIEGINEFLTNEKQKIDDEVIKSKKHYDTLCQSTESARDKSEKSASDKYKKRLEDKTIEMNIGKNDYLLNIYVANTLKKKYYYEDIPELLDYYQELNEIRVGLVNKILKNACIIERNTCDKIKEKLHSIDETIDQNNPRLDTTMYIKHNLSDWKESADVQFIPSSIWHDDDELITTGPELNILKRKLNEASNEYAKLEQRCIDSKQKLEESTGSRKTDPASLNLKFDGPLYTSLSILQTFLKDDNLRVKRDVEMQIIEKFAGDQDLSYVEQHKQKKSRFGIFKSSGGSKKSSGDNNISIPDNASDAQSLHTVKTNNSHHTTNSRFFSLRRNRGQSISSSIADSTTSGGLRGKVTYAFQSTGGDTLSINVGETFNVLEEDTDGSGWTEVRMDTGQEGLVPTAYIEIIHDYQSSTIPVQRGSISSNGDSKKKGPAVAPRRGAKKIQYIEALYDYVADGDDEISINAGDKITLIEDDIDGWTKGEINGSTGVFPSSYVRKI
ncbi:uncharacterized protein RJT21DRAFT_44083 [Scheffersomyces amazonensis]|uniref:uncharacterized protein n=1 Tax=Scheffersomyces amazonensis TaxID=1078765 RepID=UPI00315D1D7B